MKLSFALRDFDTLRKFQKAMERQFAQDAYIGTDYAVVLIDYPKELKEMIRGGQIFPSPR